MMDTNKMLAEVGRMMLTGQITEAQATWVGKLIRYDLPIVVRR